MRSIPTSLWGKGVSVLLLLVFCLLPFQQVILRKVFRHFSAGIVPEHLSLPAFFSKTVAFFPTDFVVLTVTCIVLYFKRGQWRDFFWGGPSKYLSALLLMMLLSIGGSATSDYALQYIRLFQFALIGMFFHCLRTSLSADAMVSFVRAVAWIICWLSLFECALAFAQFILQHEVGLKFLGERSQKYCAFPMPGGERWIVDRIFHITTDIQQLKRISGTFPHPNIFGGFQFCAILSTFYLFFVQTKKQWQTFLLFAVFLQVVTLMFSFSRAAMIAVVLSSVTLFYLQFRHFPAKRAHIKKLVAFFVGSLIVCVCLLYPQLSSRGGILNYNKQVSGADRERMIYHRVAWEMVKENPLLGVGFNNFQLHTERFAPKDWQVLHSKVHNIFLLFAAETGILGLSCFLLFLSSIMKRALRCLSQEGVFLLAVFAGFLFIGCCDFYLVQSPYGQILFFGASALLCSVSRKHPH